MEEHLLLHLVAKGELDRENGSDANSVEKIFADLATRRPERLVIHFHGGLVSRARGIESAARLAPEYQKAGAVPLFVVWESGLEDIISQNLGAIFHEKLFTSIYERIFSW